MKLEYTITKRISWEAAHQLTGLPPTHPCSTMHGHSYQAKISFKGANLDETGMLIDFNILNAVKVTLDHKTLNEVMGPMNPTAENICRFIYESVNRILLALDAHDEVKCVSVEVRETKNCSAKLEVVQ